MKKYKRYVLCTLNIDETTICPVFRGNFWDAEISKQSESSVLLETLRMNWNYPIFTHPCLP